MSRHIRAFVGVVAALLLAGCTAFAPNGTPTTGATSGIVPGAPTTAAAGGTAPTTGAPAGAESFYGQKLGWRDCGAGFVCATASAPLDWSTPADGKTITLSLIKQPAKGTKLGTLFVNPGGPGGSAVDFVRSSIGGADQTLQDHFDIVGFDPRGVGSSSAVKCLSDRQMDHYLYDPTPGVRGSAAWIAAQEAATKSLGQACLARTGALLGHVDTGSTVSDLDMLRSVVGDTRLSYLGYSYGTLIGSLYADRFPGNVGRMVLDGVIDPASTGDELTVQQTAGFESNLNAYLHWCFTQDQKCPFTGTVADADKKIAQTLADADVRPITNSDGRILTANTLLTAIILPLYDSGSWQYLDYLFEDVWSGSARIAFEFADQYNNRNTDGTYSSNEMIAFIAINCLDYPQNPDVAAMRAQAKKLAKIAPVMGPYFSYGDIGCVGWPFPAVRTPAPVKAAGSAPILVLGTTGDPATPYANAQHVAQELENGHLVTWHGNGHTAYGRSNSCVTDAVDRYLVDGTVPKNDPEC